MENGKMYKLMISIHFDLFFGYFLVNKKRKD